MADPRRNDKFQKKDDRAARDVRSELDEEIRSSGTKPTHKNPNRDSARGDWDRTGLKRDEGSSRAEE